MIRSFKDKVLEKCWRAGQCTKISAELKRRILMKLDSMDAAVCLDDLKNPPGNQLHSLQGDYKGYLAIAVSGPWRLIFRFKRGNIFDVQLEQYH
ncbi:MAG: type II toxin-antitoxin system RelE/ParE family toxin [Gammaproteobacteria bacterium]